MSGSRTCARLGLPVGDGDRVSRRCPDGQRCSCWEQDLAAVCDYAHAEANARGFLYRMRPDEMAGIAWWNSLTRAQRRDYMARVEADEGHEAVTAERCWRRFGDPLDHALDVLGDELSAEMIAEAHRRRERGQP